MPSGKVHDQITVVGAVISVPVWWYLAPLPRDTTTVGVLVGAILFSGLMLSPDLDLNSSIYHRWGPFKYLWWPYQRALPHRSWLSHSWLISPFLRLGYFLCMVWLLAFAVLWGMHELTGAGPLVPARTPLDIVGMLYYKYPEHSLYFALGTLIGTGLHTGADAIVTGFKRRF